MAVDPRRWLTALRARAGDGSASGGEHDLLRSNLDIIDQQAGRRQRLKALEHHRRHPD
jgi:hypothetical protein